MTAGPGSPLAAIDGVEQTAAEALPGVTAPTFFPPVFRFKRGPAVAGKPTTSANAGVLWTRRALKLANAIRVDPDPTARGFVEDADAGYSFCAYEPERPWGTAGVPVRTPRTAVIVAPYFWSSLAVFGAAWAAYVARAFAAVYTPLAERGIHVYFVRPFSDHFLLAPLTGPVPIDSGEAVESINTDPEFADGDAHSLTMRGEGPFAGGEVYWCYLGNDRQEIGFNGVLLGGSASPRPGGAYCFLSETFQTAPPSPPDPFGPITPPPGLVSVGTATQVGASTAFRLDTLVWPARVTHDGAQLLAAVPRFSKFRFTFAYRNTSRFGFFTNLTFPGQASDVLSLIDPALGVASLSLSATPATAAAALAGDILNFFVN